jgi:hypothetical protein
VLEIDALLSARGFPAMAPWWRDTLRGFYGSGKRRLVLRVGRRGGKSSTLCRVAVAEALFGGHKIPPGDVGVFAIVSVKMSEAEERLRTIAAILQAIGMRPDVDYIQRADEIEIVGKRAVFRVFSATRGASVGFTSIGLFCDELAIWRNDATGANPAREILAWLRPTMATQPRAKMFLSSSPFSTLDAHHEMFELGQTEAQVVAFATSFTANPSLDEAATHVDEPDHLEWQRQYMAVPMSAGSDSFFDPAAIAAATDPALFLPLSPAPGDVVTAGGDFGFRSDSSALVVVYRRGDMLFPAELVEMRPQPGEPLQPSRVVAEFASTLKRHGADCLMADGHYRQSIAEHLEAESLAFIMAPSGQAGIQETYVRARVLLNQGKLKLPKHERLLRQMQEITSRPTPGGGVSIVSPRKSGGGHGDLVSGLVLAIWQREGQHIEAHKPKFGTAEYWSWVRSAEYQDEQERATVERESAMVRREGEREWWQDATDD